MRKVIQVNNGYIYFKFSKTGARQLMVFSELAQRGANEVQTPADAEEFRKALAKEFNKIFGKNACWKTFGTRLPSVFQFEEFYTKFAVLLNQWCGEVS